MKLTAAEYRAVLDLIEKTGEEYEGEYDRALLRYRIAFYEEMNADMAAQGMNWPESEKAPTRYRCPLDGDSPQEH